MPPPWATPPTTAPDRLLREWADRLEGCGPSLILPISGIRPQPRNGGLGSHSISIESGLAQRVAALAATTRMTAFELMFGAFGLVLARHAASEDFVLGTAALVRDAADTSEKQDALPGELLPIRLGGDTDTPIGQWLADARDALRWAQARAALPFAKLVELAGARVEPGAPALVSIAVSHCSDGSRAVSGALLDLALSVGDAGPQGEIDLDFEYATDILDDSRVGDLGRQYLCALEYIVAHADRSIGSVALQSDESERAQATRYDSQSAQRVQRRTLAQAFEAQAAHAPEAIALREVKSGTNAICLSYAELDARATRIARCLQSNGAGPGTPVGIYMNRSASMLVAMLGIVKAGAAYVPLDPEYPSTRIAFMVEDSAMPLLLTETALKGQVPVGEKLGILVIDESGMPALLGRAVPVAPEGSAMPPTSPAPASAPVVSAPSDPAYVIYTSGSTGTPKGVVVSQASVIALVVDSDYVRFDTHDVVAQASNASFDAATWEIWGAWLNGACLTVLPREVLLQASRLASVIRGQSITRLFLTTALFNEHASSAPDTFEGLELLVFGGEAVDPAAVGRLLAGRAPLRLVNAYGPTETTTFATTFDIPTGAGEWAALSRCYRTLPIGKAIRGARCRVLDAEMRLVPVGVAGELYVGGDGVAIGYANRPELSAERFVADPLALGERLYRTGDLVRQAGDGNIEYLGRIDAQVKLRGFRIELGEIEARLVALPGVRQAAAVIREDRAGDRRLVAYLVAEGDAACAARSAAASGTTNNATLARHARDELSRELPSHMVPSAIVVLPALPLTPNGKLDRRALPAPGRDTAPPQRDLCTPGTTRAPTEDALEAAVAALFVEVLDVDAVGSSSDFFALGGHSLQATRLVSRLESRFGLRLSIRDVFKTPTVAALATMLRETARPGAGAAGGGEISGKIDAPRAPAGIAPTEAPLTAAQAALWYVCRLNGATAQYNIARALRLRGALDDARLERALRALHDRHDALRICIVSADGEPRQHARSQASFEFVRRDVESGQWRAEADAEGRRPFVLEGGALARFTLLRVSEVENVLVVAIHHIVSDGWSVGVLLRDLRALYEADGARGALEPLPIGFIDAALREGAETDGMGESSLAWWRGQLRGLPDLDLPTRAPRRRGHAYAGADVPVAIDAAMSARLRAVASARGTTPFTILMAAWQSVLGDWAGQTAFGVGVPVAGRDREDLEGLIGYFVDMVVVRAELRGDPDPSTLIARVHEATLGAIEHRDVSFDRLVAELRPQRRAATNPFFQAAFAFDSTPRALPGFGALGCDLIDLRTGTSKFDLTLQLGSGSGTIDGSLEYASALFDRPTIAGIADAFMHTLSRLLSSSEGVGPLEGRVTGTLAAEEFAVEEFAVEEFAVEESAARGRVRPTLRPRRNVTALADAAVGRAASFAGAKFAPREDTAVNAVVARSSSALPRDREAASPELIDLLLPIWRDTLDVAELGPDDDFFDHGGHSLLAVRLIDRIEKCTGHALRLASLIEGPTVRQLAASIETPVSDETARCAVAINATGAAPPLWIVSGFGGQIMPFQTLSRELGGSYPLFVLDLNSLGARLPEGFGLPDVARCMVEDLQQLQPKGPYQLAGYSLGGKIVLEMARQLLDAGEAVRLVSLLDCFGPGYPALRPLPVRVLLHLREAWRQAKGGSGAGAYLLARIRRLSRFIGRGGPTLLGADAARAATAVELRMEESAQAMLRAWEAHEPQPWPGRIMLVRSGVREFGPGAIDDDYLQGWGAFASGGIDLHHMACTHIELLEQRNLPALAAELQTRLIAPTGQ